jgi:hypothetical protein
MSTTSYIGSNNNTFLIFDDISGNVAIGTSNIDLNNKLFVQGNIVTSSNLIVNGTLTSVQGITLCNSTYLANSNDSSLAPSFSWRQDSNTGIYHSSNQSIGFSIGGIEKLRVNSTGISINSTNPSNAFDVIGNAYISSRLGIGNALPNFALDVSGAINASTYCNILINSFSNSSITLAPSALALSNVYSLGIFSCNTSIFSSNIGIFSSNSLVFPSNTSIYCSNLIPILSNTSFFASNASAFSSNVSIFASNVSVYNSNLIPNINNNIAFACNCAIFGSNNSVFSSNNIINFSNSIIFCSNTSIFASNNSVFSSNASIFSSNTSTFSCNAAIFASNQSVSAISSYWVASNTQVYTFSNVGIGISNVSNKLEVNGNSIYYSNMLIYGRCSNLLGLSPSPGCFIYVNFLTSGTIYTPSIGTGIIKVELLGGGGAGGGKTTTNNVFCGGGGAGAYGFVVLSNDIHSSCNYTYSIGAGGIGVSAQAGGSGGNTSITINGNTYTCGGGEGGIIGNVTGVRRGGFGGSNITDNFTFTSRGNDGDIGFQYNTVSGKGGSSPYGSGGTPKSTTFSGQGSNATGYGSGGSGAGSGNTTAFAGGNGTQGFILISEYT